MLADLEELQNTALADLAATTDSDALEAWRIAYLGSKGRLKGMMPRLKDVSREEKPAVGKRLNELKVALESGFETRQGELAGGPAAGPSVDVTQQRAREEGSEPPSLRAPNPRPRGRRGRGARPTRPPCARNPLPSPPEALLLNST